MFLLCFLNFERSITPHYYSAIKRHTVIDCPLGPYKCADLGQFMNDIQKGFCRLNSAILSKAKCLFSLTEIRTKWRQKQKMK